MEKLEGEILRGRALILEGKYAQARAMLEKTLLSNNLTPETEARLHNALACSWRMDGHAASALIHTTAELNVLSQNGLHRKHAFMRAHLDAAETLLQLNDANQRHTVVDHLEGALQVAEHLKLQETEDYATLMILGGRICCQAGNWKKAMPAYRHALKVLEKLGKAHNSATAVVLHNDIGFCRQGAGKLDKAVACYTHALQIAAKVFPPYHPEVARIAINLARTYLLLGRPQDALPRYEHALFVRRALWGDKHDLIKATRDLRDKCQAILDAMCVCRNGCGRRVSRPRALCSQRCAEDLWCRHPCDMQRCDLCGSYCSIVAVSDATHVGLCPMCRKQTQPK